MRRNPEVRLGVQEFGGHGVVQDGICVDFDGVGALLDNFRGAMLHYQPIEDEVVEVVNFLVRRRRNFCSNAS
eukprot:6386709-Pyramimonas_sp.AAC.1